MKKSGADVQRLKKPGEFAAAMVLIYQREDIEKRHLDADKLMCELLDILGYDMGVTVFKNMEKWYG